MYGYINKMRRRAMDTLIMKRDVQTSSNPKHITIHQPSQFRLNSPKYAPNMCDTPGSPAGAEGAGGARGEHPTTGTATPHFRHFICEITFQQFTVGMCSCRISLVDLF